jgi:hypothetical protein
MHYAGPYVVEKQLGPITYQVTWMGEATGRRNLTRIVNASDMIQWNEHSNNVPAIDEHKSYLNQNNPNTKQSSTHQVPVTNSETTITRTEQIKKTRQWNALLEMERQQNQIVQAEEQANQRSLRRTKRTQASNLQ